MAGGVKRREGDKYSKDGSEVESMGIGQSTCYRERRGKELEEAK